MNNSNVSEHRGDNGNFRRITRLCASSVLILLLAACSKQAQEEPEQLVPKGENALYFSTKAMGPAVNIYSINDAGETTKHTDDPRWRDLDVSVSPKGDIVFVSNRTENPKIDLNKRSETYDLFLKMDQQPVPTKILEQEGLEVLPSFSPDGVNISFISRTDSGHKLELLLRGRRDPKTLLSADEIVNYQWSPDSTQIAVAHNDKNQSYLDLIDVATGTKTPLLTLHLKAPDEAGFKPSDEDNYLKQFAYVHWSPDGAKIAFIRHPMYQGSRQLAFINLADQKVTRVSPPDAQVQDGVDWSSSSGTLLYSALVGYQFYWDEEQHEKVYKGGMHIFEYTLGGKNTQLTSGDHMFRSPVYSPDEKRIAYIYADALGARNYALYTMQRDGKNPQKIHDAIAASTGLTWLNMPVLQRQ